MEKRFLELFSGCQSAHGQTTVLDAQRNGKTKANSITVRTPLTIELIKEHLSGKKGIGAIPIREDNLCQFAALDIDDYNLDLLMLRKKVSRLELPLVMCRSKSGGAHLYLFMTEFIPAAEIRDKLAEMASALGFGSCELFPKQDTVKAERGDLGSWINLPYQNSEYTTRYALDESADSLTLEEFLDLASTSRLTPKELADFTIGSDEKALPDGPPCLQQMTEFGIPEGGRNTVLFNCAVYYHQAKPEGDDWKQDLENHNQSHCTPPLPAREIVTIQEQLSKGKDYYYTCKQEPLLSHCNRSLCRSRKYGVGSNQSFPSIGGLTVVESEPPVWFLDCDGHRLELSTKQLQMPQEFQRAAMEQMYKMPTRMKDADWRDMIDNLLGSATRIEVPEELTQKGLFSELLEMFCTSRLQAQSPEELLSGKPWTEDGVTYFKLSALQDFLKRKSFTHYTRGQITERLKEMSTEERADKEYRFKDNRDQWKKVRVWFIPEIIRGEVDLPPVDFDNDVPF